MFDKLTQWLRGKIKQQSAPPYSRSYAQYGEDQIILALLHIFKLENVNFLDIGANDPYVLNNTALLNDQGIFGINIEPDPQNFAKLKRARTGDVNLNIGISNNEGVLTYYRFDDSVYNTFSEKEHEKLSKVSRLQSLPSLQIPVKTYKQIIQEYLHGVAPTLLFIDTEGLDEPIIDSIDFVRYAPKVLCVETFSYGDFRKKHELISNILAKGYQIHADTFVNTIFIHESLLPYPTGSEA